MEEDESRTAGMNAPEDEPVDIVPVTDAQIRSLIYIVRGEQVMLDSDLAALYGVETRRLNENVKRNRDRFPDSFCFQLTKDEYASLMSQFATSSSGSSHGGRRKLPQVFTEQGVAMLSAVLHSNTAVSVSIKVINAFVEMRHFLADNAAMFEQIRDVRREQLEYQRSTDRRLDSIDQSLERVFDYMDAHEEPTQKVFFEGQVWDAFELLVSLVQRAEKSIVLVDGYTDAGTLNILAKKNDGVTVTIWTHPKARLTVKDVETFNAQYPTLAVRHTESFHDRFLVLDDTEAYLVGASLKDAGKKSFGIARLEDQGITSSILQSLNQDEDTES